MSAAELLDSSALLLSVLAQRGPSPGSLHGGAQRPPTRTTPTRQPPPTRISANSRAFQVRERAVDGALVGVLCMVPPPAAAATVRPRRPTPATTTNDPKAGATEERPGDDGDGGALERSHPSDASLSPWSAADDAESESFSLPRYTQEVLGLPARRAPSADGHDLPVDKPGPSPPLLNRPAPLAAGAALRTQPGDVAARLQSTRPVSCCGAGSPAAARTSTSGKVSGGGALEASPRLRTSTPGSAASVRRPLLIHVRASSLETLSHRQASSPTSAGCTLPLTPPAALRDGVAPTRLHAALPAPRSTRTDDTNPPPASPAPVVAIKPLLLNTPANGSAGGSGPAPTTAYVVPPLLPSTPRRRPTSRAAEEDARGRRSLGGAPACVEQGAPHQVSLWSAWEPKASTLRRALPQSETLLAWPAQVLRLTDLLLVAGVEAAETPRPHTSPNASSWVAGHLASPGTPRGPSSSDAAGASTLPPVVVAAAAAPRSAGTPPSSVARQVCEGRVVRRRFGWWSVTRALSFAHAPPLLRRRPWHRRKEKAGRSSSLGTPAAWAAQVSRRASVQRKACAPGSSCDHRGLPFSSRCRPHAQGGCDRRARW